MRNDCVVLVYVDDMIALSENDKILVDLVEKLREKDYVLVDEGPLAKYLGLDVKENQSGGLEPKPFLIQRIIDM